MNESDNDDSLDSSFIDDQSTEAETSDSENTEDSENSDMTD